MTRKQALWIMRVLTNVAHLCGPLTGEMLECNGFVAALHESAHRDHLSVAEAADVLALLLTSTVD